jgi:hypothetical protein
MKSFFERLCPKIQHLLSYFGMKFIADLPSELDLLHTHVISREGVERNNLFGRH